MQIEGYKVIGQRPYNPYNPSGPMVDDQVPFVPERYNAKSELSETLPPTPTSTISAWMTHQGHRHSPNGNGGISSGRTISGNSQTRLPIFRVANRVCFTINSIGAGYRLCAILKKNRKGYNRAKREPLGEEGLLAPLVWPNRAEAEDQGAKGLRREAMS